MALNGVKYKGIWFLPYMIKFGLHHRFMQFKRCLSISMYCLLWGDSLNSDALLAIVFRPRVVSLVLKQFSLQRKSSMNRLGHSRVGKAYIFATKETLGIACDGLY